MVDTLDILQRAQRGDSEAITALYQAHVASIYRYIAYRVPSEADAEDLTAEVFVKMVEGLPNYQVTGAPFAAWLYSIASARVIDFRRRAARRPQTELDEMLSSDEATPEAHLQAREEVSALRGALGRLSDEQQQVLVLRFIERRSHADVAVVIGKTESAVKSIQHRALVQLAALLGSKDKVKHYLRGQRSAKGGLVS